MRTVKSTRREEIEIISNLNVFRTACFHLHDSTMNDKIRNYIENMVLNRGYYVPVLKTSKFMHRLTDIPRISTMFSSSSLRFFRSYKFGNIRYTSINYSMPKVTDDSAVIFKLADELHFGLINSICADENNDILLEIWPLSNAKN